jgi:cell division protein FtsB
MPSGAVPLAPRRINLRRVPLVALVGLLVTVWIVLSFGRTIAALNDANARLAAIERETAALQMRIGQGEAEMELAQRPAFQRMLARSYGMGQPGERAFALDPDAPEPPPVAPLGGAAAGQGGSALDAWLELLFGD